MATTVRNDSLPTPIEGLQPHDPVWDTEAMREEFSVESFAAPFVVVTRKSDGVRGTLQFAHAPRYYFAFLAEA